MARSFLTAINLNKNELQNAVVQNLPNTSAPSSPVKGQIYFDSTGNILYWYNGSGWVAAQGGAGAVPATTVTTQAIGDTGTVGTATTYAREDHKHVMPAFGNAVPVGTFGQAAINGTAVTVSHSDHYHGTPIHDGAAHSAVPLNSLAAPTGPVNMGSQLVVSVATPVSGTDAANKTYVDNAIEGLSWKDSVRTATTSADSGIGLSGLAALADGVTPIAGNRILVKDMGAVANNGIWVAAAGAWARAADANPVTELLGAAVFVEEGTLNGDTAWVCTTNASTIASANQWAQFAGGGTVTAGAGLTQVGNTLNVIGDATMVITADQISRAPLTGDVTTVAGANAATIANGAVTNAKMANMLSAPLLKGRVTAGSGPPEDINMASLQGMVTNWLGRIYQTNVGPGTTATVTHNLASFGVMAQVVRNSAPFDTIECDVERTTNNTITLRFATSIATNEYFCVVLG